MKRNPLWLAAVPMAALVLAAPAWAQEPRITFPAQGQDVRGEINVRWEGIPDGGYGVVYIDPDTRQGATPLTASAEGSFALNTFLESVNGVRLGDGSHKLRVVAVNAAGRRSGQAEVSFTIANNKVDPDAPGRKLEHWTNADRVANRVKRYRIFAISNATVEEPQTAGGMGGEGMGGAPSMGGGASMGGAGGAGGGGDQGAALDYQISALVRRVVRDVAMVDGSANIRSVIDRAYEKMREGMQTGGGEGGAMGSAMGASIGGGGGGSASLGPGEKPPWGEWMPARETGQYYVKMIQPTGEEINATRKAPSIALGDLLPSFPRGEVRPGSTWETQMTMISELAERSPLNIRNAPMTFTSLETVTTPGGFPRECAKLESRFQLPAAQAKEEATKLASKLGTSGGGMGGGLEGGAGLSAPPASAGAAGGAGGAAPPEVKNARVRVSRVLWFDIKGHQVLRSEDVVDTNFEMESAAGGAGAMGGAMGAAPMGAPGMGMGRPGMGAFPGGAMGSAGMGAMGGMGGAMAPAEPTKVSYNQKITTWLDDTVPPPTDKFNGGAGTAHARDSVPDLSIDRINKPEPPIDSP